MSDVTKRRGRRRAKDAPTEPSKGRKLNAHQRRFVDEYVIDLNATRAAERAGYSAKSAYSQAHDLLKKPEIQTLIQAAFEARSQRTQIAADDVVRELRWIAQSDVAEVMQVDEEGRVFVRSLTDLPERVRRAISKITQRTTEVVTQDGRTVEKIQLAVEFHSKTAALRMLMDHLGMDAPKRIESTGKDGGPVETKVNHGLTPEASRAIKLRFLGIPDSAIEKKTASRESGS